MNLRILRSMTAEKSMSTEPATWLRSPISLYSGWKLMPLRPSRREVSTLCLSMPRQETMPMPVTTTRLIDTSITELKCSESAVGSEQPDFQSVGDIDDLAVDGHCPIRDTHDQFALDDAGQRQLIDHFGGGRKNFATEFYLTRA